MSIVNVLMTASLVPASSITYPMLSFLQRRIPSMPSNSLLLGFTTSWLEKEEREIGGVWVDVEHFDDEDTGDECGFDEPDFEDEDDDCAHRKSARDATSKPKRDFLVRSERNQDVPSKEQARIEDYEEHPLRTDEWRVQIKLSPFLLPGSVESALFPDSSNSVEQQPLRLKNRTRRKEQVVKFAKNGYVVLMEGDVEKDIDDESSDNQSSRVTRIGKWKIDASGVSWSIPVRSPISPTDQTTLYYHADIHLSKFQEQPRMFRGVVTRDHFHEFKLPTPGNIQITFGKNVFRPVVATFTAEGIGKDTVDTSYKNRGFGLNNGMPTNRKD